MVAAGIAEVVLHVADDRILPFEEIDRAVRTHFDIRRPEIWIIRLHDWFDFGAPEPGVGVCDFVLKDAEEPDDVGNEKISLHGIRELSAGQNLHARTRAR